MDSRYPDATKDEMDAMDDKVCIICREEMTWADRATEGVDVPVPRSDPAVAPAPVRRRRRREGDRPKKLSCNHVFHLACLKSWLERQQNCPTWSVLLSACRTSLAARLLELTQASVGYVVPVGGRS